MSQRAVILHRSPWQGVFHITGGGSGLLAELLTTPGASGTVLEAVVPYAQAALTDLLGRAPDQACSPATARSLAMSAFDRARELGAHEPFGLGCTASLATDRVKRGKHRACVAVQTTTSTYSATLQLEGDRASEERDLVEFIWHALSRTLELHLEAAPPDTFDGGITSALEHWRALVLGEETAHATAPHDGRLLLPGSFNPLHRAHRRMLALAEQITGLEGAYELSIVNVDKPLLDYTEIEERLSQFEAPVWLTRLPTFVDKARYFPGAQFAVGVDTIIRITEAGYYGSQADRDAALEELADLGTRFLVFGRRLNDSFLTLSDLELPATFQGLCREVGEAEFNEPISSTEIRRR
jgi:nicotinamide mononucleotide (NMN) deamidase PncC